MSVQFFPQAVDPLSPLLVQGVNDIGDIINKGIQRRSEQQAFQKLIDDATDPNTQEFDMNQFTKSALVDPRFSDRALSFRKQLSDESNAAVDVKSKKDLLEARLKHAKDLEELKASNKAAAEELKRAHDLIKQQTTISGRQELQSELLRSKENIAEGKRKFDEFGIAETSRRQEVDIASKERIASQRADTDIKRANIKAENVLDKETLTGENKKEIQDKKDEVKKIEIKSKEIINDKNLDSKEKDRELTKEINQSNLDDKEKARAHELAKHNLAHQNKIEQMKEQFGLKKDLESHKSELKDKGYSDAEIKLSMKNVENSAEDAVDLDEEGNLLQEASDILENHKNNPFFAGPQNKSLPFGELTADQKRLNDISFQLATKSGKSLPRIKSEFDSIVEGAFSTNKQYTVNKAYFDSKMRSHQLKVKRNNLISQMRGEGKDIVAIDRALHRLSNQEEIEIANGVKKLRSAEQSTRDDVLEELKRRKAQGQ